jgi:serine/threonine-protein kinase
MAANQDRMRRFVQEAKSAAALNHPNIATIHDIGESDGTNFIAMEFIEGHTLREEIHQECTPIPKLLKYLQQVAEGLAKAHSAGIVHRDLKPDNIMITRDRHAKILDFGLAKLVEQQPLTTSDSSEVATAVMPQHSTPGAIMGTVGYMSPEQAKAKPVDQRSDIFSFGCVLYEAATGRKPFAGESMVETLHKIISEPAPAITDSNPNAPAELQRIIRKCLAKEPEKRYQSIRDTANDLEEVLEELKGVGDIERSVVPSAGASTVAVGSAQSTHSVSQSASSAEYVVSGIKSHKLAVAVVTVLIVALLVGGYWFWSARVARADQINSIAVMPFVNESSNNDIEYLSEGMTETLIKSLSKLQNLDVKPRSAVFRYKGKDTDPQTIGRELDVQAILNGSVVQRGDQIKLNLELVDVQRNRVIWTEQYQRSPSELVSLQSQIARDVSTRLTSKFSSGEETKVTKSETSDPEAYQAYLKGRYYWNRRTAENIRKAIEQFKTATDRDPNYALAFAGLGDCYAVLAEYSGLPSSETAPQAKAYAERALSLDSQLAEAHATLGSVNRQLWQWAEAEKECKLAIEINPNYATAYHWYSILLKEMGRNKEAAMAIKRAHEIDPLSSVISVNIAELNQLQNNQDASIETTLKIIELDPSYAGAYEDLGISYAIKGRFVEAVMAAEKAIELAKRSGVTLGSLGYVYAAAGRRTEALAVVKELENKYARKEAIGIDLATVYAGLGDKDKAFEWLERDFQTRNGKLGSIRWTVTLNNLRDDPRFKDLLKRMNLPE